jgi:hypothetical protein
MASSSANAARCGTQKPLNSALLFLRYTDLPRRSIGGLTLRAAVEMLAGRFRVQLPDRVYRDGGMADAMKR